ncbi:MAG: hypothetical protein LQ351_002177 [Letrouitia transgressa]|nr:MAG: hypothetical protein LQ351_002177 [Letrouitia transgressa]
MVFTPPSWIPEMPAIPDSIPICDFMLDERYGRHPICDAKPPFTCGLTGTEYSAREVCRRVERLARALSQELGWKPNEGTEWDKVAGVFSVNTIDTLSVSWAIHRLAGISSPVNASYTLSELEYQLRSSGSTALFTCLPLLSLATEAASRCGIPRSRIFLLNVPQELTKNLSIPNDIRTVDQLIDDGERLPQLEELKWEEGQGVRQTAFLCYSSGTSGLPHVRKSIPGEDDQERQ